MLGLTPISKEEAAQIKVGNNKYIYRADSGGGFEAKVTILKVHGASTFDARIDKIRNQGLYATREGEIVVIFTHQLYKKAKKT